MFHNNEQQCDTLPNSDATQTRHYKLNSKKSTTNIDVDNRQHNERRPADNKKPTRSGHQSRKGRENIPVAGTTRGRGERISNHDAFVHTRSQEGSTVGMQLRAAAILLVNGVAPKVFQLQHNGNFDTHSDESERLDTLLADLRVGVYTFVQTAQVRVTYQHSRHRDVVQVPLKVRDSFTS
eukprot:87021-Prorocentrum_minimum.AAC.3